MRTIQVLPIHILENLFCIIFLQWHHLLIGEQLLVQQNYYFNFLICLKLFYNIIKKNVHPPVCSSLFSSQKSSFTYNLAIYYTEKQILGYLKKYIKYVRV